MSTSEPVLLRAEGIVKSFGPVNALQEVSISVRPGEVACLLGDNGAGKSTLIKILSGAIQPDGGSLLVEDTPVAFTHPRHAIAAGIATVYQDLALVPILPIYRNFVLGAEPVKGYGPLRWLDVARAKLITEHELKAIGVDLVDASRPLATLSGGQRQCVAIARAVHIGAKVLILDEPTSALGVRQSEIVLRYIGETTRRSVGVILVTHNPVHAYRVGDTFTILEHGKVKTVWTREEVDVDELVRAMANRDPNPAVDG